MTLNGNIDVYIEKSMHNKMDEVSEYAIDFYSLDEAQLLFSSFFETKYSPLKFYKLVLPYKKYNVMASGSWYSLPIKLFKNATYRVLNEEDVESSAYSGIITIERLRVKLSNFLTPQKRLDDEFKSCVNENNLDLIKIQGELDSEEFKLELTIVDCGQGNWNEISTINDVLIYDMGASQSHSEIQTKTLVSDRRKVHGYKNTVIVISHWDMDHFQALKYLGNEKLKKITAVYGPSNIPPTNVYRDMIRHLKGYKIPCNLIPPTTKRQGRRIDLNLLSSTVDIDLYRATSGSSRNQTGIVLGVKGVRGKILLLTGDHHYNKILNAIEDRYDGKDVILVVPHHGGEAGTISVADWRNKFKSIDCVISVGSNSYGHPNQNLRKLEKLQGSSPKRTDQNGNVIYEI
ncbi:hypothetical protein [Shewanella algae]|uniref:hypothetical protein n=1 Tax=Shewanella algae TaxID=38313 RepID=UPI0031F57557